jgi:hypothetical protein
VIRPFALLLLLPAVLPAWTESVEFPWNAYPKPLWERELVWLKNIGITHVSLPPAKDSPGLNDLLAIIRRLDIEVDLEGPVPDELQPLTRAHGGPLTDPLPATTPRISILAPGAITRAREVLASGASAIVWTDVEETLGPAGYRPGAVNFAGEEKAASTSLRRNAQLSAYWNKAFSSFREVPGAGVTTATGAAASKAPARLASVRQFASDNGASVVCVVNKSANAWRGDLKVFYPAAKHAITVSGVRVPPQDALWLPVNVPLTDGPLCKDCSAFANTDHVVYATAELTTMEYENGILAMEFAAPSGGDVVLQLSREPSGPLVAGGKPAQFDWDDQTKRARLHIPAGTGTASHVRIGLAIEPPDATAFFDSARVLMIGETNHLTAEFSSEAVAQRSRLRTAPAFATDQEAGKEPLHLTYNVKVPATAVHGDHADLAIEADGMQMSHARPQLLRPVSLRFPDAIDVHLTAASALPLFPATIAVNQRNGRDLAISLRNNAPEIRTFVLEPKADGLDFSPAKLEVTVGVSTSRDVSFRVFARGASPGLHAGSIEVSGAATASEPVQFVVVPVSGAVAYAASGFSFIESAKSRASFMPGRWLELIGKDSGQNQLASSGVAFLPGGGEPKGDALFFPGEQKTIRLEDLEAQVPKVKR